MLKLLLRKTSFVDYPEKCSAVFFLPGCNLRCPWCHNRELITGRAENLSNLEECLAHLEKRRNVLQGVVISGGEPCLWDELPEIIYKIKKVAIQDDSLPLPVKLDTNGTFPAMLKKLFESKETRPDYIALDLKVSPRRYTELIAIDTHASEDPGVLLSRSAELIKASGIAHEYRTLALPPAYITEKDIEELAPLADNSPWHFSPFRGGNCLDSEWDGKEESPEAAKSQAQALAKKAVELGKRGIAHT